MTSVPDDVFALLDLHDDTDQWRAQQNAEHARVLAGDTPPANVRTLLPRDGASAGDDHQDPDPEPEPEPTGDDLGPTGWEPLDLADALAGKDVPPPDLMARTDGVHLLYRGRVHWFQGESESCKSWGAVVAAEERLTAGELVLWVDFEDDAGGVVSRLLALGVPADTIRHRFHYLHPEMGLYDRHGKPTRGALAFAELLTRHSYGLAVVDGVTESMTLEDLELISNADVAQWLRRIPKRLASTGAAVVVIDHVTKSTEGRGRYALGGQHKLAGVTGAVYSFHVVTPFRRVVHGTEPVTGLVTLKVEKDRPGYVRGKADEGRVAVLRLTAYPDGGITAELAAPGESNDAPAGELVRRILEYLDIYDGSSGRKVEDGVEGKGPAIRDALRWLTERGWLTVERKGNAHLHYLTAEGREQLPDAGREE